MGRTLGPQGDRTAPRRSARLAVLLGVVGAALVGAPVASAVDASMQDVTETIGARDYWRAGFTGAGVDVAVIDTGVTGVQGLDAPGKLLLGPDLSFDSQSPELAQRDAYGHGTHLAGIIAGRDVAGSPAQLAADATSFLGVAPDARIVSVRAGDFGGEVDVTQVIAAIDWVVEHRNDPGFNIRVINMAYANDSLQSHTADPIAHAVEAAWKAGIVVVVSGGNSGGFVIQPSDSKGLMHPARDPFVIAVGASETHGTPTYSDDTVAGFSNLGDGQNNQKRNPDVVAPGRSVVSLRVPGGFVDDNYADTGAVDVRMFRGSGSSQSSAVVAGAAALIVQQRPSATPDQVKRLLMSSATPLPGQTLQQQGSGQIDLRTALRAATPSYTQRWERSKGNGSIQSSRGSFLVVMDGVKLEGDVDIFGRELKTIHLAAARNRGAAWVGGVWFGRSLASGLGATSVFVPITPWAGRTWSGRTWSSLAWSGRTWSGRTWSGRTWSEQAWSGRTWSGRTWSDQSFASASWE